MQPGAPRRGPDPRRWWALALLCGAFFMVILDAAIVIVALPSIEADLGFTEQSLQWVISAYALTFAGLLLALLLPGRPRRTVRRRLEPVPANVIDVKPSSMKGEHDAAA